MLHSSLVRLGLSNGPFAPPTLVNADGLNHHEIIVELASVVNAIYSVDGDRPGNTG
jgi:hypothetical protein